MKNYATPKKSTKKFQASTVNNSVEPFDTILKKANVKIYAYRDKYVLVNSGNFAFLMFEKLTENHPYHDSTIFPTIQLVDISINCKLSSLPVAQYIPFSQLSNSNLRYMCEIYSKSKFARYPYRSKTERINRFVLRFKVSPRFAKLLSSFNEATDFKAICKDIKEANIFLGYHPNLIPILEEGTDSEKIEVLSKLLPDETFKTLGLNIEKHWVINTVVNEILANAK